MENRVKIKIIFKEIFRAVVVLIGWIFIFIGIAGVVLPIIPGWLLIILGLTMIGSPLVTKIMKRIRKEKKKLNRRFIKKKN